MNQRWKKIFRQLNRTPEVARCARITHQWWPLACAYAGLRPLSFPYEVLLKDGGRVMLTDFFDLSTFWPIFFTPTYPVDPADRVIVDAGANVGMFTLYARRRAPAARIAAIEPFPPTFERLQAAIARNKLSGVTCLNAALGDASGEALMPTEEMGSQFRQVLTSPASTGIAVRVMTLRQALDSLGLDRVDHLKMDIEGGEYPSLLSAGPDVLRRIRRIYLEYHPATSEDCNIERLTAHLKDNGLTRVFHRYDGDGYGMAHFQNRP
jgi:FkbM family methyltransferase